MPMLPDVHSVNGKHFLAQVYICVKAGAKIQCRVTV